MWQKVWSLASRENAGIAGLAEGVVFKGVEC